MGFCIINILYSGGLIFYIIYLSRGGGVELRADQILEWGILRLVHLPELKDRGEIGRAIQGVAPTLGCGGDETPPPPKTWGGGGSPRSQTFGPAVAYFVGLRRMATPTLRSSTPLRRGGRSPAPPPPKSYVPPSSLHRISTISIILFL